MDDRKFCSPVIRTSKDNAWADKIFDEGGSEHAELESKANKLLQRFCKRKVLLILAAY